MEVLFRPIPLLVIDLNEVEKQVLARSRCTTWFSSPTLNFINQHSSYFSRVCSRHRPFDSNYEAVFSWVSARIQSITRSVNIIFSLLTESTHSLFGVYCCLVECQTFLFGHFSYYNGSRGAVLGLYMGTVSAHISLEWVRTLSRRLSASLDEMLLVVPIGIATNAVRYIQIFDRTVAASPGSSKSWIRLCQNCNLGKNCNLRGFITKWILISAGVLSHIVF